MGELEFGGKTVLVVGGSSGIGNGIAQAFRARGASVHVWGTRPAAEDYAGSPSSDLTGLAYRQVDVADIDGVGALDPGFEALDILVLSQGGPMHDDSEFDLGNFQKQLDLNLASVMACAMKFHDRLKDARGSLIVIGSISAFHANATLPAYAAAKAGVARLVTVLASAWAREGVRVNSIAPGLVLTKAAKSSRDPAMAARAREIIPMGRTGTPEDMAGAALYLASPLASYVTGQTLIVDGGLSLT